MEGGPPDLPYQPATGDTRHDCGTDGKKPQADQRAEPRRKGADLPSAVNPDHLDSWLAPP
ncbi:MAG: hypothetical protein Q9214_004250 [Letrouitia sp. 1 TL-2023]